MPENELLWLIVTKSKLSCLPLKLDRCVFGKREQQNNRISVDTASRECTGEGISTAPEASLGNAATAERLYN